MSISERAEKARDIVLMVMICILVGINLGNSTKALAVNELQPSNRQRVWTAEDGDVSYVEMYIGIC